MSTLVSTPVFIIPGPRNINVFIPARYVTLRYVTLQGEGRAKEETRDFFFLSFSIDDEKSTQTRLSLPLVSFFQLYEINDDPKRKEFLDDLFSYMQKRGKCSSPLSPPSLFHPPSSSSSSFERTLFPLLLFFFLSRDAAR